VIRARDEAGNLISIDQVPYGLGDLGLTRDLADGAMVATKVANGTSYRAHRCPRGLR
jgi:hypothetical protein